jgi:hypothetical protein
MVSKWVFSERESEHRQSHLPPGLPAVHPPDPTPPPPPPPTTPPSPSLPPAPPSQHPARAFLFTFGEVLTLVIGLVGGAFGANAWIKEKAREAVQAPEFLSDLSKKVRPSVIFDAHGSILVDQGAMEFLEKIEAVPDPDPLMSAWNNAHPARLVVTPKKPLTHPPLLTPLVAMYIPNDFTRVPNGSAWSLSFTNVEFADDTRAQEAAKGGRPFRYRLEILF